MLRKAQAHPSSRIQITIQPSMSTMLCDCQTACYSLTRRRAAATQHNPNGLLPWLHKDRTSSPRTPGQQKGWIFCRRPKKLICLDCILAHEDIKEKKNNVISSFRNVTLEAVCLCDAFYLLALFLQILGCICIVERTYC